MKSTASAPQEARRRTGPAESRPRTIWIINQYAGSRYHGMEFRHYDLGRIFARRGHRIYVISGSYSHLFSQLPDVSGTFTPETIDAINYCWVRVPRYGRSTGAGRAFNMIAFMLQLLRLGRARLPRPDAIIVSSPSPLPIFSAHRRARKLGARLILEVRDLWPLTLVELGQMSRHHPFVVLTRWCERFAYRKADLVVSVLPHAIEHMAARGLSAERFRYIPNGIRMENGADRQPLAQDLLELLPRDRFLIGYTGALGIPNAMEYLVEAAKLLQAERRFHFVIVGNGAERDALKQMARSVRNMTFLDPVPRAQVQSLLARFDVCYIGWRDQSIYRFGVSANKLFEYMLAARPIVHSTGSPDDPVKLARCGVSVAPEDPQAIAAAIRGLEAMEAGDRDLLGANGKAYVLEHHAYETLAERYLGLLE